MENEFYQYVKEEIKKIPNSSSFDVYSIIISEDDFLSHLNKKYTLELINFNQKSILNVNNDWIDGTTSNEVEDTITYHYKLNNQLYLKYIVFSKDLKNDFPYLLREMTVYSNNVNKSEHISFIEYIGEYIKNK